MLLPERWHHLPPEPVPTALPMTLAESGIRTLLVMHNPLPAYLPAYVGFMNAAQDIANEQGISLVSVPTLSDSEASIAALRQAYTASKSTTETTGILAIGGDGTYNTALRGARKLGGLATLLVAGGHKCDLAHITNNDETLRHPELLLHSPIVKRPIYPLFVTIHPAESTTAAQQNTIEFEAYQSYSEGLSAKVIETVQDHSHRNHRMTRLIGRDNWDKLVTLRLSMPDRLRAIRSHTHHSGSEWHPSVEFLIANSGRMAGVMRPAVEFDQPYARVLQSRGTLGVFATSFALMRGLPIGRLMPKEITRQVHTPNGLRGQRDGEPFFINEQDLIISIRQAYEAEAKTLPNVVTLADYKPAGSRTHYHPKLRPEQNRLVRRAKRGDPIETSAILAA